MNLHQSLPQATRSEWYHYELTIIQTVPSTSQSIDTPNTTQTPEYTKDKM
jgi:hypothetical protein